MFRLLIVDDERIILNGIRLMIEKKPNLSFGVDIAIASNVPEALEILGFFRPDLILTDIRMPVVDGFELIKHVRQSEPSVKIVILTSHADFEYAQKAIRYQVTDFILKPIDPQQLKDTIENVYQEKKIREKKQLQSTVMEVRNMMLYDLSDQELTIEQESISQLFPYTYFTVIVLEVAEWEPSWIGLMEKILLKYYDKCYCFSQKERSQLIAICNHSQFQVKSAPFEEEFQKESGIRAIWGGNSISANTYKVLHSLYLNALQRVFYNRHFGKDSVITGVCLITYQNCVQIFLENDAVQSRRLLREIIVKMEAVSEQQLTLEEIYRSFFCNIQLYLTNNYIAVPEKLIEDTLSAAPIKDQGALILTISEKLTKLKKSIMSNVHYSDDIVVKKMLEYIRKHYHEDVSLEELADYMGFTSSYVCAIFKKRVGKSYLECIHQNRLEEAKILLLESDYTIEHIAEAVGYKSGTQFGRVFRKYEGVSPSMYRISAKKE